MSDIVRAVRQTFDLAALRLKAERSLTADDWHVYQRVTKAHAKMRGSAERAYGLEYQNRMATVSKRLIDEAGSKGQNFTFRWFGRDRFSKSAINQQAQIVVELAHRRDLAAIDESETESLKRLLAKAERRGRLREVPKRDFANAIDRRSTPDRRIRRRS